MLKHVEHTNTVSETHTMAVISRICPQFEHHTGVRSVQSGSAKRAISPLLSSKVGLHLGIHAAFIRRSNQRAAKAMLISSDTRPRLIRAALGMASIAANRSCLSLGALEPDRQPALRTGS